MPEAEERWTEAVARFRALVAEAAELRARRKVGPANLRISRSHELAVRVLADAEGRAAFRRLLDDENAWVRIDAAGRLLPDDVAVRVLTELAEGTGRAAFDADMQLTAAGLRRGDRGNRPASSVGDNHEHPPAGEDGDLEGDRAADLAFEFHGLARASGLAAAVEQLDSEGRLDDVRSAWQLLELPAVAALLHVGSEDEADAREAAYDRLVTDEGLEGHVAALASRRQDLFSPTWRP